MDFIMIVILPFLAVAMIGMLSIAWKASSKKEKISFVLVLIIVTPLYFCLLASWTDTLKTSTPAGTDDPREADDRMREIKAAFVERFDIDHYCEASATSTYDAADTGKHRYVTFREPNDLTSMSADESALFSKDVNSLTELHWIDESDNVLQLTSKGANLANDAYLIAGDIAGTGTVDLIKADANDDVVLADGAELATSAAPTTDQAIANKKYVDDKSVDSTPTAVYTKYLTGTLDGTSPDTIAHGVADYDKILAVSLMLGVVADSKYYVWDYASGSSSSAFYSYYGATNITIVYIGAFASADTKYRIKIDYIL